MTEENKSPKGHPTNQITSEKLIPPIPLPFEEVMKDVLKVKPPKDELKRSSKPSSGTRRKRGH